MILNQVQQHKHCSLSPACTDEMLTRLAASLDGWAGRDIEHLIAYAIFESNRANRNIEIPNTIVTPEHLEIARQFIINNKVRSQFSRVEETTPEREERRHRETLAANLLQNTKQLLAQAITNYHQQYQVSAAGFSFNRGGITRNGFYKVLRLLPQNERKQLFKQINEGEIEFYEEMFKKLNAMPCAHRDRQNATSTQSSSATSSSTLKVSDNRPCCPYVAHLKNRAKNIIAAAKAALPELSEQDCEHAICDIRHALADLEQELTGTLANPELRPEGRITAFFKGLA